MVTVNNWGQTSEGYAYPWFHPKLFASCLCHVKKPVPSTPAPCSDALSCLFCCDRLWPPEITSSISHLSHKLLLPGVLSRVTKESLIQCALWYPLFWAKMIHEQSIYNSEGSSALWSKMKISNKQNKTLNKMYNIIWSTFSEVCPIQETLDWTNQPKVIKFCVVLSFFFKVVKSEWKGHLMFWVWLVGGVCFIFVCVTVFHPCGLLQRQKVGLSQCERLCWR